MLQNKYYLFAISTFKYLTIELATTGKSEGNELYWNI